MAQHTCNDADVRSVEECPACQADIADERLGILLVTVRVEIPVVFPFPADADESGTTWDDIRGRAVELVRSRLIPGFGMGGLALYSELVALNRARVRRSLQRPSRRWRRGLQADDHRDPREAAPLGAVPPEGGGEVTRKADTIRVRVDDHLPDPEFEVIDGIEKGMTGLGAGWSALDRMGRRMEKGMVGEGSAINATLDESIIVRAPTKSRAIALLREAISGLPYRLVFEAGDPTCRCGHPFSRHQTGEGVWTGFCYAMLEGGDLNDCKCERPEEVID